MPKSDISNDLLLLLGLATNFGHQNSDFRHTRTSNVRFLAVTVRFRTDVGLRTDIGQFSDFGQTSDKLRPDFTRRILDSYFRLCTSDRLRTSYFIYYSSDFGFWTSVSDLTQQILDYGQRSDFEFQTSDLGLWTDFGLQTSYFRLRTDFGIYASDRLQTYDFEFQSFNFRL